MQAVPGGFSAKNSALESDFGVLPKHRDFCGKCIPRPCEAAFPDSLVLHFLHRWISRPSVLIPGKTNEKPYFRNCRISVMPSLGKLRCSPVTRFFMFTVPDAISDSPVIERKGIERLSAYSNCFFSFAASG